jgi:hypothetical protein
MTPRYRMPPSPSLSLLSPPPPPPPTSLLLLLLLLLLPGRIQMLLVCCSFCLATADHIPSAATRQAQLLLLPSLR